jgi:predicted nucleotidyltransferase component of viral defense system
LVFGGGTALCRAHHLLRRMSEDIDLKIVGDEPISRSALRALREALTASLQDVGFRFDPSNPGHRESRNESRYTIFRLPNEPLSRGEAALRPDIRIELAVWPLRRPSLELPVSSFVAEAFKREPEVARIACVSVTQTAAEKLVALTRRTAAELADARGPRDPADIRHLYDLHMIRENYDFAEVAALAQGIMGHDAEIFGHQFPAYRDDPLAETRRAVSALAAEGDYAGRYAEFCRLMVYGDQPAYAEALSTIHALTERLQGP